MVAAMASDATFRFSKLNGPSWSPWAQVAFGLFNRRARAGVRLRRIRHRDEDPAAP